MCVCERTEGVAGIPSCCLTGADGLAVSRGAAVRVRRLALALQHLDNRDVHRGHGFFVIFLFFYRMGETVRGFSSVLFFHVVHFCDQLQLLRKHQRTL